VVRRSLPPLKWLLEMILSSTLTIISSASSSTDPSSIPLLDLAYVRHRLPHHAVFYDLSYAEHVEFSSVKDATVTDHKDRDIVRLDEDRSFNADQWKASAIYALSHVAGKVKWQFYVNHLTTTNNLTLYYMPHATVLAATYQW